LEAPHKAAPEAKFAEHSVVVPILKMTVPVGEPSIEPTLAEYLTLEPVITFVGTADTVVAVGAR
jgi:hypothetical protein